MKKGIIFSTIVSIFLLLFASPMYASSTSTTSASASPSAKLQNMINAVNAEAAKLHLTEKRGIIGTVTETSGTQITLTDDTNSLQYVDLDEITKFSSSTNKSFGLSDLIKGTKIAVLGLYNKDSQRILARFISPISLPKINYGVITSVDKKNFVFYVTTLSDTNIYMDVQTTSRTYLYQNGALQKVGFSKITQNEPVLVVGFPDAKNTDHILPSRIILFPDITVDPLIQHTIVSASATTTPTQTPKKTK